MLTKQAREKIAKRAREIIDGGKIRPIYTIFIGDLIPSDTTPLENCIKMYSIILDLCDTSDMMELPRDKDGEVIHVGDTVYDENMNKCSVKSIKYVKDNNAYIACFNFFTKGILTYSPNQLTHTFISEAEQLAKALKHAVDTFNEYLREVASYMGSLGDNND